jgi:energy-coupling factor transporter ATP-binding protein EcfA2
VRVASVELKGFKRFAHLSIQGLPATARLMVVAGPNGFGKSSLFDAFNLWSRQQSSHGYHNDADYYDRRRSPSAARVDPALGRSVVEPDALPRSMDVVFHDGQPAASSTEAKKAFYFRSAYRNDPELATGGLSRLGPALDERRFNRLIDTDSAVNSNYQRLVSEAFDDMFEREAAGTTVGDWRERVVSELRDAMRRLFPHLVLNGLGSPLRDPTFRFTKGEMQGFNYKNLSGGEKSAFDLLLDLVVKRREYDDTVFCIDEPEAHLNPRVHGPLLDELVRLVPESGQLWVATHAIGMMRAARDMEARAPGRVAFLDFEGHDFDQPVTLHPVRPTRAFWARALAAALADLADLVAPRELVVCEGSPAGAVPGKNADHDARCYGRIFGDEMPEVAFVSGGNSNDVSRDRWGIAGTFPAVVKGTAVRLLIDRDDHSAEDVADHNAKGVRVLGRRNIEAYLYDDEVLRLLCDEHGKPDRVGDLLSAKDAALKDSASRGRPADDLKPAAPGIYLAAKRLLGLTGVGNDNRSFERNVLAPLIKPGTRVHGALRADIFGAPGEAPAP